jgi:Glyoxalase-like domain
MLALDHVIVAVENLDTATERVRSRYGWGTCDGGRHPGGTENRAVPLGGTQYLELITPYDPDLSLGREVWQRLAKGEGWFGWGLEDSDLDATAARLALTIDEGSIEGSDGQRGTWRIAGIEQSEDSDGALPFFIDYGSDRSTTWAQRYGEAKHVDPPTGISWVEVSFDEEVVRHWLAGSDLPIRLIDGPPGLCSVGIGCQSGAVTEIREW